LTEWGLGCGWSAAPTNHTPKSLFSAALAPRSFRGAAGVSPALNGKQAVLLCRNRAIIKAEFSHSAVLNEFVQLATFRICSRKGMDHVEKKVPILLAA
jgi:hypothetical protein